MVNGMEIAGRAVWIGKIKRLTAQAKGSEGALIGVVYECLPDILRKQLKSEFKDWEEFIKNAQDIKEADICQSAKEDERITTLKRQLNEPRCHFDAPAAAQPLPTPASPTAPLHTMMGNFSVSCPSMPIQSPHQPSQSNLFLQGGSTLYQ